MIATLIALSAGAWVILASQRSSAGDDMSLTMGMTASLFLAIWLTMINNPAMPSEGMGAP